MSTTAVIPSPDTIATLPVGSLVVTYNAIVELDEKGVISKKGLNTSEKKAKEIEAPDYKGKEVIAFKQIVSRPVVGTLAGFDSLFPDADSKLFIINYGLARWADSKARAVLLETNDDDTQIVFQPTEAPFDLTPHLQETPARKLSQEEVALNTLKKLGVSDDMIRSVFANIQAAKAQAAVAMAPASE
jgi:hypothetical protein